MRERRWVVRIGHRLPDVDSLNTGNRENVAWAADCFIDSLETLEGIELRDFRFLKSSVELDDSNFVAKMERAVKNTCDGETAEVVAVVEIRHQHLQRAVRIACRIGNVFHNCFGE